MLHLLGAYRAILIRGELPEQRGLLILTVICAGLLALSYGAFKRASRHFVWEL
jgi:ABC-type polysaccharide/polyol phosphate export permease